MKLEILLGARNYNCSYLRVSLLFTFVNVPWQNFRGFYACLSLREKERREDLPIDFRHNFTIVIILQRIMKTPSVCITALSNKVPLYITFFTQADGKQDTIFTRLDPVGIDSSYSRWNTAWLLFLIKIDEIRIFFLYSRQFYIIRNVNLFISSLLAIM